MKRKPYTVQEKAELLKSDAIEKIAHSSVTYSKEFKLFAVGEYMTGKTPKQIFIEAGVNVKIKQFSATCLPHCLARLAENVPSDFRPSHSARSRSRVPTRLPLTKQHSVVLFGRVLSTSRKTIHWIVLLGRVPLKSLAQRISVRTKSGLRKRGGDRAFGS